MVKRMGNVKFLDNSETAERFRSALSLGEPMAEERIESYVISVLSSGRTKRNTLTPLIDAIQKSYDPKDVKLINLDGTDSYLRVAMRGYRVVIFISSYDSADDFLNRWNLKSNCDFRFLIRNMMRQYSGSETGRVYMIFAATKPFDLYRESNVVLYDDCVGMDDKIPDIDTFPQEFLDSVRGRTITKVSQGEPVDDPYIFVQFRYGRDGINSGYINLSDKSGRCETCAKCGNGCSGVKGGLVGPWKKNPCYVAKE